MDLIPGGDIRFHSTMSSHVDIGTFDTNDPSHYSVSDETRLDYGDMDRFHLVCGHSDSNCTDEETITWGRPG
jgi:hypothetical protein